MKRSNLCDVKLCSRQALYRGRNIQLCGKHSIEVDADLHPKVQRLMEELRAQVREAEDAADSMGLF